MSIEQEYIFTSNPVFGYSPEQLLFLALDTASTDRSGAANLFQTGTTALAEMKAPGTFQQIGEWIAKAGNLASVLTKDLDLENLFLSVWEGPQNIGLLESWILDQKIDDKIRCLYLRLLNTLCKEDCYETGRFLALWQELGRKAEAGEDAGTLAWQLVQMSSDINMPEYAACIQDDSDSMKALRKQARLAVSARLPRRRHCRGRFRYRAV